MQTIAYLRRHFSRFSQEEQQDIIIEVERNILKQNENSFDKLLKYIGRYESDILENSRERELGEALRKKAQRIITAQICLKLNSSGCSELENLSDDDLSQEEFISELLESLGTSKMISNMSIDYIREDLNLRRQSNDSIQVEQPMEPSRFDDYPSGDAPRTGDSSSRQNLEYLLYSDESKPRCGTDLYVVMKYYFLANDKPEDIGDRWPANEIVECLNKQHLPYKDGDYNYNNVDNAKKAWKILISKILDRYKNEEDFYKAVRRSVINQTEDVAI